MFRLRAPRALTSRRQKQRISRKQLIFRVAGKGWYVELADGDFAGPF